MIGVIIKCNFNKWGGRRGLNPRPPESQSGALPTELRPPSHCLRPILRQVNYNITKRLKWRARQDSNLRPTA